MKTSRFRVWDKLNKRMSGIGHVLNAEGNLLTDTDPHGIDMGGKQTYRFDSNYEFAGSFIGITDKNGMDICQGDICHISHPYKNRKWTGEVIINNCFATGKGFNFSHFDTPHMLFSEGTEFIEVIGNIYENPELLKS